MKKLFLSIVFSVLYVLPTSADMGINIGVSGSAGLFAASANESFSDTGAASKASNQNGSEHGEAAWGSIFLEKTIGSVLVVGIDYVPMALETEETETSKQDKQQEPGGAQGDADAITDAVNKLQVDFEDLTTLYVAARIGENFYAKAGVMQVDVITNEKLGTGGSYPNAELDGTVFGVGYNVTNDNGTFIRFEGNYMAFDAQTVTNTVDTNKSIKLKNLDGVSGKLSVGKTF